MSDLSLLKALYRPDLVVPVKGLVDLADAIQGQIVSLAEDPTSERFSAVLANLDGAKRAVSRIAEELHGCGEAR